MTGLPPVLLDACVLVNFSLCDTLLRLAEPPRLYEPRWSQQVIAETTRALEAKLNWPRNLVAHFESELRTHFEDAWVEGCDHLIGSVGNEPKDRHVLAIVTPRLQQGPRRHGVLEPTCRCRVLNHSLRRKPQLRG